MAKREITQREREVIGLVARGLRSADIAERLRISQATVESHVRSAQAKLGAASRLQAAWLLADHDHRAELRSELEPEQRRLLELLAGGMTRADAAKAIYLSRRSVDRRLAALRRRYGAHSTVELVLVALGR